MSAAILRKNVLATITPNPQSAQPLAVNIEVLVPLVKGGPVSGLSLKGSGGTGGYVYAATGLPTGLTLNAATGAITGTPTVTGHFVIAASVQDSSTTLSPGTLTLEILPMTVAISNSPVTRGVPVVGLYLSAAHGSGTYTYSAVGLPAGLTLNTATGVITGTATAVVATYSVTLGATDTYGNTAAATINIAVLNPLYGINVTPPDCEDQQTYYYAMAVGGNTGTISWAVHTGALPLGLSIDPATGEIVGATSGTASGSGTVRASDATTGNVIDFAFNITGHSQPIPTLPDRLFNSTVGTFLLPPLYIGTPWTTKALATGGVPPYTFGLTVPGALTGLVTIDASTGVISGSVTDSALATGYASVYPITVLVYDTLHVSGDPLHVIAANIAVLNVAHVAQYKLNGSSVGNPGPQVQNYVGPFTLTVSAGTSTLTLPQATTSVDGYLSHADWGTFNAKGSVSSVALSLPAMFSVSGSPITTSGTISATLASQAAHAVFIGPTILSASPTFRALVASDLPAGTGTVTSVGLSLPAIFTVTVSPITTSGTLTASLATQTANTLFAGPSSGSAAAPTFRAMVGDDLPTLHTKHESFNVTLSAGWAAASSACFVLEGTGGAFGVISSSPLFMQNAIFGGSGWNYKANGTACNLYLNAGTLNFQTAPTGTAGGIAPMTNVFTVSNTGVAQANTFKTSTWLDAYANAQGSYIGWNRSGGTGEMNLINHHGGGSGAWTFIDTDGTTFKVCATIDSLGQVKASNYGSALIDKTVVTATVALDFRNGDHQAFQTTTATACTVSWTLPSNPCRFAVRVKAPAAGTSPAVTWPAMKGTAPTAFTLNTQSMLWFEYDGTNVFYMGGCLNV